MASTVIDYFPRLRASLMAAVTALVFATTAVVTTSGVHGEEHVAWPQWRGLRRDGQSDERGLLRDWRSAPPRSAWTVEHVGRGFSTPATTGDGLYVNGHFGEEEFLVAFRWPAGTGVATPEPTWRTSLGKTGDVSYPGSRSTPTVDGDRIYAQSTGGAIVCLNRATGDIIWQRHLVEDFGGTMMSHWGFSESPLVDGEQVIVTPGSDAAAVVALNKSTGATNWKSEIESAGGAAYSSLVVSEGAGVRQYITLLGRGLVGVAADNGRLLWTYDRIANKTANIPTPIVRGDDVFTSTGYQTGAALVHLSRDGEKVKAEEVYFLPPKTLQNHHGGLVLVGDHVYGGAGHKQGFPICVEFATGKVVWSRPRGPGDGSAAVSYADGHLYFRYQNGTMALIEATPEGYHEKGQFEIPQVEDPSWPHPVITRGLLLLREQDRIHAYDCHEPPRSAAR